jgi:RNA polymerase sigma-B factor
MSFAEQLPMTTQRSDDAAALFAEYQQTGDRAVRNRIVESHRDVAEYYIKRYSRRGVPADDLRQVALLTMLRAVDRFDPDKGVEFSTFASRTIEGELKRYFRDRTWMVRPPRRAQELHLALRRADEDLNHRLGRSPTVQELAAELDETVDHVLEAMEAGVAHQATSLDHPSPGDEGDGASRAERMVAHNDESFDRIDEKMLVRDLLAQLPEREREVIELRFFENLTQEEIAERIGVSQSYLSRILRRVLLDLRRRAVQGAALESDDDDLLTG